MPAWSSLTPIASALDDIAQRFGLSVKLLEHRLQRHWPAIVGEHVAAHTRPESIRFKKLYVIADSSVWVQQLTFLKPSLLASINATAGNPIVTDIVLRVGEAEHQAHVDGLGSSSGSAKTQPAHPLTAESLAEVSRHAEAVEDPGLRAHLTDVMARALANPSDPKK
jgi:predicted nucleic acid-binding Zn ribbon protein